MFPPRALCADHGLLCVCHTLVLRVFHLFYHRGCFQFSTDAGECGVIVGPHSTKLPESRDTESDQLGVPATTFEHAVQFDRFDSWWLHVFLP